MELQILSDIMLEAYLAEVPHGIQQTFESLKDAELSTDHFSFYTSVASVFSSKIEGEDIDLDSFIKHKRDGLPFQPDYTKKTDDLYSAYMFAQKNVCSEENIKEAHRIISRHILPEKWQGTYRHQNMYVATDDGRIEYVAAAPQFVESEMNKLFYDIEKLLDCRLSIEQTLYYAAMIHLVFVKIHPWNDANGRCARLLEKWFMAEKLGAQAWFIQSEKLYYQQHETYYKNIRLLGLEYPYLDYGQSLPFLLMLPASITKK